MRAYYSDTIRNFLSTPDELLLGKIVNNNQFKLEEKQRNAWNYEIKHLKKILTHFDGRVLFEYTVPRMGKRIDVILLINDIVFILEYKHGEKHYPNNARDQVMDYALDLKNFQKESHEKLLVPILIATEANIKNFVLETYKDKILNPLTTNGSDLAEIIDAVSIKYPNQKQFDYIAWENSLYMPTPTIIEAAQALYSGHSVKEITRSDSGRANLTATANSINKIIDDSKKYKRKSIVFITGVPGAGKTLAGLNIANERHKFKEEEHAVFLSGNGPLVEVLQEALARDRFEKENISKREALRETASFIQIIHRFRDDCLATTEAPVERVAIFDEAQRAWTLEQIAKFMRQKKGKDNFQYSEPEFLISTMDRHKDWAVIVCLIGGGQEINTGEAGLPEWFDSMKRRFRHWDVFTSDQLFQKEYAHGREENEMICGLNVKKLNELHLATSIRSFRSEKVSEFIRLILDNEKDKARQLYGEIESDYPILLTRDLTKAKKWVKCIARGSERYGLIAYSKALRLKPDGIFVKNDVSPSEWFLNNKDDVRSSYYLEDVATEFAIQGLELDYTIVAFDADFRHDGARWTYNNFVGTKWQQVNDDVRKRYLKNAYRVLLTRARQGMIIFVPRGDDDDPTRLKKFYDQTYQYLRDCGIESLKKDSGNVLFGECGEENNPFI
jgi:hypothetical protein